MNIIENPSLIMRLGVGITNFARGCGSVKFLNGRQLHLRVTFHSLLVLGYFRLHRQPQLVK